MWKSGTVVFHRCAQFKQRRKNGPSLSQRGRKGKAKCVLLSQYYSKSWPFRHQASNFSSNAEKGRKARKGGTEWTKVGEGWGEMRDEPLFPLTLGDMDIPFLPSFLLLLLHFLPFHHPPPFLFPFPIRHSSASSTLFCCRLSPIAFWASQGKMFRLLAESIKLQPKAQVRPRTAPVQPRVC